MSLLKEIGYAAGLALSAFFMGFFAWPLTHPKPPANSVPLAQAKAVQAQDARGAQISQDAAVSATKAQAQIKTVHDKIIERIPVYVPQPVPVQAFEGDSHYVSLGFVRVWNAAATGDVSGLSASPGGAEAGRSAVSEADVARAHAADTEHCASEIAKYDQLWIWSQQQARLAEGGHGRPVH